MMHGRDEGPVYHRGDGQISGFPHYAFLLLNCMHSFFLSLNCMQSSLHGNGALTSPRRACSPICVASYGAPGPQTMSSMAYIFTHDCSHKSVWDSHPITEARNNFTVCDLYHHTYPERLELKERW